MIPVAENRLEPASEAVRQVEPQRVEEVVQSVRVALVQAL